MINVNNIVATHIAFHQSFAHVGFWQLSQDAQNFIMDATSGKYEKSDPPELPDSVKKEVMEWLKRKDVIERCKAIKHKKPVSF